MMAYFNVWYTVSLFTGQTLFRSAWFTPAKKAKYNEFKPYLEFDLMAVAHVEYELTIE